MTSAVTQIIELPGIKPCLDEQHFRKVSYCRSALVIDRVLQGPVTPRKISNLPNKMHSSSQPIPFTVTKIHIPVSWTDISIYVTLLLNLMIRLAGF